MITNATLTTWKRATGSDRYGQPTHTPQSGSWRVIAEPSARQLKIDGRDVVAGLKVHFPDPNYPAVSNGDLVTVDGAEYRVLHTATTRHGTLGHLTLWLAV